MVSRALRVTGTAAGSGTIRGEEYISKKMKSSGILLFFEVRHKF